jgi:Flp pilus assembly pilin Flp
MDRLKQYAVLAALIVIAVVLGIPVVAKHINNAFMNLGIKIMSNVGP